MNGGNKLYIYKDGFGDGYKATPAEEAEWAQEVIANALVKIDTEINAVSFKGAIDTLRFHNHPDLKDLLVKKMATASASRQVFFATALWTIYRYERSFELLVLNLLQHRGECLNDVFMSLGDFKENASAKKFIVTCMEGNDDVLITKANMTLGIWAYSGMPALRENNLLQSLQLENKSGTSFKPAVQQLKQILEVI